MTRGRSAGIRVLGRLSGAESLRRHWPEYLMEAAALGIFMVSAGVFTTLLEYPRSLVHLAIPNADLRRAMIGVAMGGTAAGLIYSPWGKRSGAHMNPAITAAFLRLGKIPLWDALFYVVFQFAGGLAGVLLTACALGAWFTGAPVNYVATVPGPKGELPAFAGELAIGLIMMAMIVYVSNKPPIARWTGLFAGLLIACFVGLEALPSGIWTALWIYFTAAPLGMLLAAQGYLMAKGADSVECCKLHHRSDHPCIFCGRAVTPAFS
jgi:aquaporin Z